MELWLEPWPDDRFYHTGLCLPRPVFHFKKNSRDKTTFGCTNPDSVHRFSFLVCTARTARTSGLELQQYPRPDDRIFRTGACLSRTVLHFKINSQPRFEFERVDFELVCATSFLASLDCTGRVLTLLSLLPCRTFESYQATIKNPGSIIGHPQPFVSPFIPSVLLPFGSSPYLSLPVECSFLRAHQVVMIFGLQRKSSKEKSPRQTFSQPPFKYSLNNFDELVSVQERLDIRCKDHIKMTRDEADPKRRLLQFDVQEICDNFEKRMMKALKDISKSQKKSTSTRAPVAEPSLFISEKPKEPIENLFSCEKNYDLPSLESEFMNDNEQTIVELTVLQPKHPSSLVLSPQVFEEEPLDLPHQGPRRDTRISFDEDLDPIFDEEDEPGPIFDEEATNITSIAMESHLCFDPGTTPAPLSSELQEHCEQPDLLNSQYDMFVKITSLDVNRFGLEKSSETDKTWHFLRSIFDNCVVLSLDDIVVYNTFFEKHLESLIVDSQSELKLVCSDVEQDMHVLKMNTIVAYLDKILVRNVYFDVHLDKLKYPGVLVFVLSIQERQVQPLRNKSIDRAQQPEIWRSFFVQTGCLGDASDKGSIKNGYLNIQKVFCHESNFLGKPTHQGFTEA
uniref:Uncharacterized protein n=1 Tax=Brassica oleracea var. oleracea TaxID=109376 RepID=A0A0D3DQU8_BRAOL